MSCAMTAFAVSAGIAKTDTDRSPGRRKVDGIDADDTAFDVEGRAAGIARVDRRVNLDQVLIYVRVGALFRGDRALTGRDDP
jgi:hypothetical protein